ncbi:MAG: hypothetical protein JJU29_23470 [Verrucomicrobia bacterium]|nr:hypothetical protein [Verrucomicrobiota bacterium]
MRKLTRTEIEACGAAMPETMRFHDQLVGSKLIRATGRRGRTQPPPVLYFDDGGCLRTQFDDECNPGETEWMICDAQGHTMNVVKLTDLIGLPVTGIGYLLDPDNDLRPVIPYVEIAESFHVCAICREGGAVICHHRAQDDSWDLLCELKPKTQTKGKS